MHFSNSITALLGLVSAAAAQQQGFNYGATNNDGSCRHYAGFHSSFTRAQSLAEPGFSSARLYTSIQCGSTNAPIEAIKAAIDTNTDLLLGIWASGGQATVTNEIAAIKQAASNYGQSLKSRVVGISVGSEDLYRSSAVGQANNAGVGADPATVVSYIKQLRTALRGTALAGVKIGHVDTWTAWELGTSKSVINACDFLGHNGFPYFETTKPNNAIGVAKKNFQDGLAVTTNAAAGKPVWVTETGWPTKGAVSGQAVASVANAKSYWNQVGCSLLFGKRNAWWYTLYDANTAQTDISFAVVNAGAGSKFNLQCPA